MGSNMEQNAIDNTISWAIEKDLHMLMAQIGSTR